MTTSTSVTVTPPALDPDDHAAEHAAEREGLPATFTIAATAPAGDSVRNVTVDWGDGTAARILARFPAHVSVSHVYKTAATFPITGTVTDDCGNW